MPEAPPDQIGPGQSDKDHTKRDEEHADEEPIYCPSCQMWLRDQFQWEDHKIGKKHRKNTRSGGKNFMS